MYAAVWATAMASRARRTFSNGLRLATGKVEMACTSKAIDLPDLEPAVTYCVHTGLLVAAAGVRRTGARNWQQRRHARRRLMRGTQRLAFVHRGALSRYNVSNSARCTICSSSVAFIVMAKQHVLASCLLPRAPCALGQIIVLNLFCDGSAKNLEGNLHVRQS